MSTLDRTYPSAPSTPAGDRPPVGRPVRAPWTVHASAVLVALVTTVTMAGAAYFAFNPDPARPDTAPPEGSWQAITLLAVFLTYGLVALASLPRLYRRRVTAWRIALGYLAAHLLFGALKFLGLGEGAALTFVVGDLLAAAALLAPATRRYVGA